LAPKDLLSGFGLERRQAVVLVALMQAQLMAHGHGDTPVAQEMGGVRSQQVTDLGEDMAL
jgi:hypothetical protein